MVYLTTDSEIRIGLPQGLRNMIHDGRAFVTLRILGYMIFNIRDRWLDLRSIPMPSLVTTPSLLLVRALYPSRS